MPVRQYSVKTGGVLALPLDAAVRLVHLRSGDAALRIYMFFRTAGFSTKPSR
jgi:hypothetical protein